jgi:hypothetical protein
MPRVPGHTFTLEDALRVVEAAGLDPSRPLLDQQNGHGDMDERISALADTVDQLVEALSPPADQEPVNSAEVQARAFATKLAESQSQWFSTGGSSDE